MASHEADPAAGESSAVALPPCSEETRGSSSLAARVAPRETSPLDYQFPEFVPYRWLRNGHAQTFAGAYVPHRRVRYRAVCHALSLPDGDRTALHDDCPPTWRDGAPCVLMLHGLGGSHLSPYMVRMAEKLQGRGMRAFRLDLRGHGAAWDWAQHPGHAGRSEDAREAIELILRLAPHSPLAVLGISLGGNILLKLLGEWGGRTPPALRQAMIVSPPADLAHCSRNLLNSVNPLYTRAFLGALRRQVRLRRKIIPAMANLKLPREPANLWEFDDWVTAPLSGFRDAAEYYDACSACRVMEHVRVPTVILAAADDPVIPIQSLEQAPLSPTTRLHITPHGGHVGYVGVSGRDPDRRWLDWRVLEWLELGLRTGVSPDDSVR